MDTTPDSRPPLRFGRTRPGGWPALRVAVPLGLAASLALGLAKVLLLNPDGPYKWLGGIILGLFVAPWSIALSWVVLVDRSTLPGGVRNPEASVENVWYSQAATDAFHTVLVACGLGAAIVPFWFPQVVSTTLVVVFLVAALAFGVSYLVRRAR